MTLLPRVLSLGKGLISGKCCTWMNADLLAYFPLPPVLSSVCYWGADGVLLYFMWLWSYVLCRSDFCRWRCLFLVTDINCMLWSGCFGYIFWNSLLGLTFRVTTCMENLEMSGNLTAVREMSGILPKVGEVSGKKSGKSGLKLFIVSCIFASILDFSEFFAFCFGSDHALLHSYPYRRQ